MLEAMLRNSTENSCYLLTAIKLMFSFINMYVGCLGPAFTLWGVWSRSSSVLYLLHYIFVFSSLWLRKFKADQLTWIFRDFFFNEGSYFHTLSGVSGVLFLHFMGFPSSTFTRWRRSRGPSLTQYPNFFNTIVNFYVTNCDDYEE